MKTALVLSGGGAKGAFQAGAIEELAERGFEFQSVAGVSVGALNGVMVAANRIDRMIDIWQTITEGDVLKKRSILRLLSKLGWYRLGLGSPPKSIYSNDPLFDLLKREFRDIELKMPLVIGRVDLRTGEYINTISPQASDFTKEVLASTAIPVIWDPVKIDGGLLVDGGIRNMTPLKDVIKNQPDRIVVITTRPLGGQIKDKSIRSIIDIAERSLDIVLDEIFLEDLKRCMQINRLVLQAEEQGVTLKSESGEALKYYELIIIEPPEPLGGTLNFDRVNVNRLLFLGREAVQKKLKS